MLYFDKIPFNSGVTMKISLQQCCALDLEDSRCELLLDSEVDGSIDVAEFMHLTPALMPTASFETTRTSN